MKTVRALLLRNTITAIALPLLLLTLFLIRDQEQSGREALDRSLMAATLMAELLPPDLPPAQLQRELKRLQPDLGLRLTLIREDGTVLADTEADPAKMENHLSRPEVQQALREGVGRSERRSATLREGMLYLARVDGAGARRRICRAAVPLASVVRQSRHTQLTLLWGVSAMFLFSLFLSARLGRQIVAPVEALSHAAERFSQGDLNARVIPDGPGSLLQLGSTFNAMVERLGSQVRRLDQAQGYLDAVIRQMPEGLLVLDGGGTVARVNAAAEALLGLGPDRILGRPILAVVLNYDLDREVMRVLEARPSSGADRSAMVDLQAGDGKSLRVAVGPLVVQGRPAGAVVILQDLSEMRRVDDMRRDFVANVSHELRTPVAAIRALAETLVLRGEKRPDLIRDYAPRIVEECERIERLVQDLLLLAQTEAGHLRLSPEPLDPRTVAEEVLRQVEPLAEASGTGLELAEFAVAQVSADRFALSQCARNLVDNALRHAAGGTVRVGSRLDGDQVVLYVSDTGPGIPPEDLPRVFERFYRVDKHRSREGGGSGLGLSIVRHLAEAQGGRVWVESRVGEGSTFFLSLPRLVD
jgi:two-component system phosphate regulon sensor histidine kinase PhoR